MSSAARQLFILHSYREVTMKAIVLGVVTLFSALLITGCNTVEGFGKDVEKGGEAIQRTADQ